jgi:membrane protease YdiL (CAAX protease family)
MNSTAAPPAILPRAPADSSIAPAWHTAIVLCVILGVSLLGARANLRSIFGLHGRLPGYLLAIIIEWTIVAFIGWGLKRRGIRLSDLIRGRWTRRMGAVRDLGIGVAFILILGGAIQVLGTLFKVAPPQSMLAMLPRTWFEILVWVLLSMTGGFCEEVIFRGYLQRQFAALTQSLAVGIVFQAIAFGLAHGYQGWKLMTLITLYGACFGMLAHWRQSLRPGIIGHALQDVAGGVLARVAMH